MSFLRKPSRAFTLIELVVVAAIVGVISIIVLTSHVSFSRTTALSNTAYDIALSLRNAQTFGIGSRNALGVRNAGYGIEFSTANPSSFRVFADTNPAVAAGLTPNQRPGDGHYCANATAPCTGADTPSQTYALNNGIIISKFCGVHTNGTTYCTDSAGGNQISKLDIVFVRPNTFASTSVYTNTWLWQGLIRGCVSVRSPEGAMRHITVSRIGQVSTASSCP